MFDEVLVWLDVEATGLDNNAKLLEVGVIVTDADLKELDRLEVRLTLPNGPISEWALRTFTKNGLLDACRADGVPPHVAEAKLVGFLSKYGPTGLIASGSSVSSDLAYLSSWMPNVHAMFAHQTVDVTTMLILQKRWGLDFPNAPKPRRAHRAMWDAEDSLWLLRFYKDKWLAPQVSQSSRPGSSSSAS
jgi:oligoribonuclease (3'-5' exoribonuclease)